MVTSAEGDTLVESFEMATSAGSNKEENIPEMGVDEFLDSKQMRCVKSIEAHVRGKTISAPMANPPLLIFQGQTLRDHL